MRDRRYYSVQVGDDYTDDYGSTVKREAFRMARREAKSNPDKEVRIALRTVENSDVEDVIIIQEGKIDD